MSCALCSGGFFHHMRRGTKEPQEYPKKAWRDKENRGVVRQIYLCDMVHSPTPSLHSHQILHHVPGKGDKKVIRICTSQHLTLCLSEQTVYGVQPKSNNLILHDSSLILLTAVSIKCSSPGIRRETSPLIQLFKQPKDLWSCKNNVRMR